MRCIVTAGPTYEPLDKVRRLTNFSTGKLGIELADFLTDRGHAVTLLLGTGATHRRISRPPPTVDFTTTVDLQQRLQSLASEKVQAVFHAAAVCDFAFTKVCERLPNGDLVEVASGKISSRGLPLVAELWPTPKIIGQLRGWYPGSRLVGWKYEVDGDRPQVVAKAVQQIRDCRTDACVANGPAYGPGFGLVTPDARCVHLESRGDLFEALAGLVED